MVSALIKFVCMNSCLKNMCNSFPAFSLGPTPLRRVAIGFSSPVIPTQIFVQYPIIPMDIFGIQHPVYTFSLESCPRFALKSRIPSCQIIRIPGPEKPKALFITMEKRDQFWFLGNCPPTPHLSHHFALSEK